MDYYNRKLNCVHVYDYRVYNVVVSVEHVHSGGHRETRDCVVNRLMSMENAYSRERHANL